ncbi:MAG TPA: hypothetical protein VFS23_04615 [Vicinamibacterales bacterium]|nr:hypothetical protein [Vicinamibacterales bacterium]
MPYYHVLISLNNESQQLRVVFHDLSELQLRTQFARPYAKGADLVCGNEIVPVARICRRHIVRTTQPEKDERDALNAKSLAEIDAMNRQPGGVIFLSAGRGYNPEDILEVGEDVTSQYIQGPPGYASRSGILAAFVNNQWILAIVTGLIVTGVAWWLGWN